MCIQLEGETLIGAVAAGAALTLATIFNVRRLWRGFSEASDERAWLEAVNDYAPALVVNGIWVFIVFLAARSCGLFA